MKNSLLLSFLIIISTSLFAQDYQIVNTESSNLFISENNEINAIRIDSTYINDEYTIFKNVSNIIEVELFECVNVYGNSWFGQDIIIYENGENIITNLYNETISIQTDQTEWNLYHYDNHYIKATVTSIDTKEFISLTDEVKTITLQAYDIDGYLVANEYNGKEIWLSKNYGLIKTFDFLNFPEDARIYDIYGSDIVPESQQNITYRDIYNYNIYDEFHMELGNTEYPNESISEVIKIITDVNCSEDENAVTYQFRWIERKEIFEVGNDTPIIEYIDEIREETFDFTIYPESLPLEPIIPNEATIYSNHLNFSNIYYRHIIEPRLYLEMEENCFVSGLDDSPSKTNIEGCGNFYTSGFSLYYKHLKYFDKGNGDEWGEPFELEYILNTEYNKTAIDFIISPNPVQDKIKIEFNSEIKSIEICSIDGRILFQNGKCYSGDYIDVSIYDSGIYFIRLMDENGIKITKKIIKN